MGNEAVDQLTKFNRALVDNSDEQNQRVVDGIVLTKFDTIDDKVGVVWHGGCGVARWVWCGMVGGDMHSYMGWHDHMINVYSSLQSHVCVCVCV